MKEKRWKTAIIWITAAVWLCLCFFLSSQKLTDTTQLSAAITHFILKIFGLPGQTYYMPIFDGVRLAAHVLVFAVLTMLICAALLLTIKKKRTAFLISFAAGAVLSVGSEIGKLYVNGRHCSVSDMILNLLGCILGIGLIYIFKNRQ